LREFIATDAIANCAYGFRHLRMWGAEVDPRFAWIYRLFGYRAGQVLPTRRLHFNPIPVDVPRARWLCTTIRIQHVGTCDEARRQAHVEKYRQADPVGEYGTTNFGGSPSGPPRSNRGRPDPVGDRCCSGPRTSWTPCPSDIENPATVGVGAAAAVYLWHASANMP